MTKINLENHSQLGFHLHHKVDKYFNYSNPSFNEGFFILWVFMNMRYIITESRLQDIFDRYMESTYDLRYYSDTREFRVGKRLGPIFGDFWEKIYPFLTIYIKLKIMKHILNDLTEQEKNSIREQHTGGMKVMTESFSKLINSKLGDSKPLVSEKK